MLELLFFCRDDWIRTSDPLHPMQVRYQAALHPETPCKNKDWRIIFKMKCSSNSCFLSAANRSGDARQKL